MGFSFDDFSNWGNISGQQVSQSGPSAKNTDGNSYSTQTGNSNSLQWGNKNSFQHGVSNSVLLGMSFSTNVAGSFSTTLGFSFSTTVGAAFSMQAAISIAGFIGPKFSVNRSWELSASWASKYTWIKDEKEFELKEGEFTAVDKEAKFAKDANKWLGTQNLVAQSDIQKIVDGNLSYVSLTQNVAREVSQTIGGSNSATASIHNLNSIQGGQLSVGALVRISAPTVKITGTLVNIA